MKRYFFSMALAAASLSHSWVRRSRPYVVLRDDGTLADK